MRALCDLLCVCLEATCWTLVSHWSLVASSMCVVRGACVGNPAEHGHILCMCVRRDLRGQGSCGQ